MPHKTGAPTSSAEAFNAFIKCAEDPKNCLSPAASSFWSHSSCKPPVNPRWLLVGTSLDMPVLLGVCRTAILQVTPRALHEVKMNMYGSQPKPDHCPLTECNLCLELRLMQSPILPQHKFYV
jgi:hypothetical protein